MGQFKFVSARHKMPALLLWNKKEKVECDFGPVGLTPNPLGFVYHTRMVFSAFSLYDEPQSMFCLSLSLPYRFWKDCGK